MKSEARLRSYGTDTVRTNTIPAAIASMPATPWLIDPSTNTLWQVAVKLPARSVPREPHVTELQESVMKMLMPVTTKVIPPSATTSRSNMDYSLEVMDVLAGPIGNLGMVRTKTV